MYRKTIPVANFDSLKFRVYSELNKFKICVVEKKNSISKEVFEKEFVLKKKQDFDFEKMIEDVLIEYAKLKDIETHVVNYFQEKNIKDIEIPNISGE